MSIVDDIARDLDASLPKPEMFLSAFRALEGRIPQAFLDPEVRKEALERIADMALLNIEAHGEFTFGAEESYVSPSFDHVLSIYTRTVATRIAVERAMQRQHL